MKIIFMLFVTLYTFTASAADWEKFGESPMGKSYVDVDNIKKRNNIVYYFRLFDYSQPSPVGVNSSVSKFTVDCLSEKITWINSVYYSLPMGKGKIIKQKTSNKTLYPRPDSIEYITMKYACNYKQFNT